MNYKIPDNYKVLNGKKDFSFKTISLRSIKKNDIELIRSWRNKQTKILRQKEIISKKTQEEYFRNYVWSTMHSSNPKQILLSIRKDKQTIGYGGFVNISWDDKRAEISFLVSDQIADKKFLYKTIFTEFIYLIQNIAFNDLNFNRIYTETYDIRPLHISILENNKFKLEGRMKSHVMIDNKEVDSLIHACLKNDEK